MSIPAALAQPAPAHTNAFWDHLDKAVCEKQTISAQPTQKMSQKVCDILRQANTSEDRLRRIPIAIELLKQLIENVSFLDGLVESNGVLSSVFSSFVSRVLSHPSDSNYMPMKIELVKALDALFGTECKLKSSAKAITGGLLQVLKSVNEQEELVTVTLNLTFKLVANVPDTHDVICSNSQVFSQAAKECVETRTWMKLLNIMWSANVYPHTRGTFLECLPDIVKSISSDSILLFDVDKTNFIKCATGSKMLLIVGLDDMVLVNGDSFIALPFDAVDGINLDATNLLTLDINADFPDFQGDTMEIHLATKPSSDQVKMLFVRISKGESQPDVSSSDEPAQPETTQARPKSSIAMFMADTQVTDTCDESLFSEAPQNQNEQDAPPIVVDMGADSASSSPDLRASKESPSPLEIENPEPYSFQIVPPKLEQDAFLQKFTLSLTEKITAGIDSLTKSRVECIDRFGQRVTSSVDTFKEDIRTTVRDREHGSMKQLEISKDKFLANIQQFKRKAGSMHQSLLGIEEDTQKMLEKMGEIQKTLRRELQQRRIGLESELKRLRKMIRSQNNDEDDSDPIEEYDIESLRHPITAK